MASKIDTLRTCGDSGKVNMSILVSISLTVGLLTFSPGYLKSGFRVCLSPPPLLSPSEGWLLLNVCVKPSFQKILSASRPPAEREVNNCSLRCLHRITLRVE